MRTCLLSRSMARLLRLQKLLFLLVLFCLTCFVYLLWDPPNPPVNRRHIHMQHARSAHAWQNSFRTAQFLSEANRSLTAGSTRSQQLQSDSEAHAAWRSDSGKLGWSDTRSKGTKASVLAVAASRVTPRVPNAPPSSSLHGEPEDQQPPRKLLCVRFTGRLGNELFEYASTLGLALTLNRTPVFLESGVLAWSLKDFRVSATDLSLTQLKARCTQAREIQEDSAYKFKDEMTALDPRYDYKVGSYLQSYRYFEPHEAVIRKAVTFKDWVQATVENVVQRIRRRYNSSVLVGVHIRHGDMATAHNQALGYPLASPDYINKSLTYFRSLFPDCVFVVGSDSIGWCQNNFPKGHDNVHFLTPNHPAVDMMVLASMNHVITSFGSFSWWVGYLNAGRTVYMKDFIRPNTFIGGCFNPQGKDYIYPGWIPL